MAYLKHPNHPCESVLIRGWLFMLRYAGAALGIPYECGNLKRDGYS